MAGFDKVSSRWPIGAQSLGNQNSAFGFDHFGEFFQEQVHFVPITPIRFEVTRHAMLMIFPAILLPPWIALPKLLRMAGPRGVRKRLTSDS